MFIAQSEMHIINPNLETQYVILSLAAIEKCELKDISKEEIFNGSYYLRSWPSIG